ncbi:DUF4388 domain-containing protein [Pampinifervens florentissimum]|uniref:DUF4388 domain-containing protein n=1 Tax=Pampinifervens florentissimum TaxID=1632019 RepID=UPI0013B496B8|nr:DUF4388 domain-containing protein [Hydrogenobacter sp. T-8]QID32796.1 DUF4388 domain-containing protein [Hydrogenobacter sp. T-8]
MALTGDLKTFNFVDILQIIAKDRKSGILLVEWKDITVAYYVKDGEIIFARPVDRVFRVYAERDFDLLIEKLRISKENLFRTVQRFLIERLDMKEGVFSFTPGFVRYNSNYSVVYPVENIIMMASRTLTPEEVERKISDELILFEPVEGSEERLKRVELTPEERKVFSLVNGERTVYDIRKDSGLENLTVDRALYGFLALGVIKRKKKERKQKPSIALDLLMKIIERIREL